MGSSDVTNRVWLCDGSAIVHHRVDLSASDVVVDSHQHELCAADPRIYRTDDETRKRVLAACMRALQTDEPQHLEGVAATTKTDNRRVTGSGLVIPLEEPIRLMVCQYGHRFEKSALTAKESEVVACLARGEDPEKQLEIEPSTVTTHKSNAKRKLNVENDVELGVWAARNGLV